MTCVVHYIQSQRVVVFRSAIFITNERGGGSILPPQKDQAARQQSWKGNNLVSPNRQAQPLRNNSKKNGLDKHLPKIFVFWDRTKTCESEWLPQIYIYHMLDLLMDKS